MRNRLLVSLLASLALVPVALKATPLSWDQVKRTALQGNPSLVSARRAVDAARAALTIVDAGLWPSVNAVAGINRSQTQPVAPDGTTLTEGGSTSGSYSGGAQANWALFNGFGTLYARAKAMATLGQSQAAYDAQSATLLLQLHQAFNQLLYDQENELLLKSIADRYHQDSRYQELQFQSGHSARWEFLKSQSDEAQVDWDLSQNDLNRGSDSADLAALMGQDPSQSTGLAIQGELTATAPPAEDAADWARVRASSPALRQQQAAVAQAEAAVGQARAVLYPSLSAAGSYLYSGGDSWGPQQSVASASLNLSFNLFAGGAGVGAVAQAQAQLDSARKDLEDQLLQARAAFRKAWAAYVGATGRVPVQRLASVSGEERFRTVGALYNAGRAAYLDYEQAESIYTQAQQQELSARLAAVQAEAQYQQQLGLGLDDAPAAEQP